MDKTILKKLAETVGHLLENKAHKATTYLSEKLVVNVTHPIYGPKGKKRILRGSSVHLVVKIGKPNYAESEFIKKFKKKTGKIPTGTWFKYPPKRK